MLDDDYSAEPRDYKGCNDGDCIAYIRINTVNHPTEAAILTKLKQERRLSVEFRKFLRNMQGQQELPF